MLTSTLLPSTNIGAEVTARVVIDALTCSTTSDSLGFCRFDYSNINPPVDYLAKGCGCWYMLEDEPDNMHRISIVATSGPTSVRSDTTVLDAFFGRRALCLPLLSPQSVFSSVDRVELIVDASVEPQLDVALRFLCCAPRTISWHSIPAMPNTVGSTSPLTVWVSNPVQYPASSTEVRVVCPSTHLGSIVSGSISCNDGNVAAFLNGDGDLTFTVNLQPNTTFTCSWEVMWAAQGNGNYRCSVTDVAMNTVSYSNMGRPMPEDRCSSPRSTAFIVSPQIGAPVGSASGDPHFVGFRGRHFDFHGFAKRVFNLVSDTTFQLNALFLDADMRPLKTKTYLGSLGILACGKNGLERLLYACNREDHEYIVTFNNNRVQPGDKIESGSLSIERKLRENGKTILKTPEYSVQMHFSSSKHSSCHINLKINYNPKKGTRPHGVLGQTSYSNELEGEDTDYIVKSGDLFGHDFKYDRFVGECRETHTHEVVGIQYKLRAGGE
eukprot:CAMPEP_0168524602 /NCGR_PEP_ID=MMETSP0405-20121227/10754_1 /TAXON_ID=498012 /ORGANISM="Trichosphaerium sp, Strain Am-I-7 wt" /LENGTH=494 /DNA_ID=CAMNT_0008546853 /DNA_START=242 /DNA_END=1726 /DNA_ORIENTATION=+